MTTVELGEVIERDADITDGESLRIPSLFQLGERARLGSLEAKLELLVAAAALTGAEYSLDQWWVAYMDLQTEQAETAGVPPPTKAGRVGPRRNVRGA